ncbi:hypothetical protein [Anaeromyxobacter diazotrophicus]|uniref:Uncharacterized protein n=1 Tax=Anaeromyxobacter diazotrophicus TaxID=2590199 RepID=A0A7I9VLS9_9BACT|nr:hypothetical protein [Anaeromyxobacter diazotrophicus]GEJ57366.1 hypothetical protein AMYX_21070 [Anaeromyxobacter diazotrophicus]
MTNTAAVPAAEVPAFHVHGRMPALVKGLWIAALCAALSAGFLSQVWHAPSDAQLHAEACAAAMQGHAC